MSNQSPNTIRPSPATHASGLATTHHHAAFLKWRLIKNHCGKLNANGMARISIRVTSCDKAPVAFESSAPSAFTKGVARYQPNKVETIHHHALTSLWRSQIHW